MNNQNYRKLILILALLASLSLLLGACSSSTPEPTTAVEVPTLPPQVAPDRLEPVSPEDLRGSIWQWSGGREPLESPSFQVPTPEKYTLTFNEDGSLFVQADCNTSRGTYDLSDDQLTITLGATTLVACEVDSLSDHFMANLGQAEQVGTGFGSLVIVLADQAGEMYFQPKAAPDLATNLNPITQDELVDILWQWTNLVETPPAADVGVGDPENYDLVFRADGSYSAKADCNRLNGT